MTLLISLIAYAIAGMLAGSLSGLLGIGGGVVIVPALLFIFRDNPQFPPAVLMHIAAGTSLAVMIFLAPNSIRAHAKKGPILWPVFQKLFPGIAVGTVAGAILANYMSTYILKIIFGIFLLFVAGKMGFDMVKTTNKESHFPTSWINRLVSFFIGLKSGLLGVGGGILIIPYLHYCGIEMKKIAPVSSLCTLTVGVIGSISFILTGWNEPNLPTYSTGFVYWPAVALLALFSSFFAPIGAKLAYVLPVNQVKYCFIVLLILTAINLLK